MSGRNLPDNLWRCVIVAASGNRGTHTCIPAAARRTYHPSERVAEFEVCVPRFACRNQRQPSAVLADPGCSC